MVIMECSRCLNERMKDMLASALTLFTLSYCRFTFSIKQPRVLRNRIPIASIIPEEANPLMNYFKNSLSMIFNHNLM